MAEKTITMGLDEYIAKETELESLRALLQLDLEESEEKIENSEETRKVSKVAGVKIYKQYILEILQKYNYNVVEDVKVRLIDLEEK